jgi:hypothetical protein
MKRHRSFILFFGGTLLGLYIMYILITLNAVPQ